MSTTFRLFPQAASTTANSVDALYFFLVAVAAFFSILIFGLIFFFAIRHRRRVAREVPQEVRGGLTLEIIWTVIPFGLVMVMFAWGASVYLEVARPPDNALQAYVVGKQWMWKTQHMEGQREINELHVPVGRPVKLTMTSEDVIHSFYVPDFRVKWDVLPGKYTTVWFHPTRTGKFRLFCAEYCGTKHSGMIGWIHVMEPAAYESWLSGGGASGSLASSGEKLFQDLACGNCHRVDQPGRCPDLTGLFGKPVRLADGRSVVADEAYIRESIVNPGAKITAGFQPIMPTFQGLVTEEGMLQLIEYIKSLSGRPAGAQAPPGTAPAPERQAAGERGPSLPGSAPEKR
ncbi:MAG: cytochrome c oxidase subunit II [Bryobacterales bacterium]|nr:cytochrome c oxidase subunit II [Bryobacterales bacterium]